jgi:prepilin-type processing-associated H-X9-DG protein
LKQVGTATLLYTQDFDEEFFPASTSVNGYARAWYWGCDATSPCTTSSTQKGRADLALLYPYEHAYQIQDCPEADSIKQSAGTYDFYPAYGLNTSYLVTSPPAFMSKVLEPANTVLLADNANSFTLPLNRINTLAPPSSKNPAFHGRHNGLGDVLWADGHVKAVPPVYRTDLTRASQTYGSLVSIQVGDLAPGPITGVAATDDYYFELTKP